jgi:hypothetical protein
VSSDELERRRLWRTLRRATDHARRSSLSSCLWSWFAGWHERWPHAALRRRAGEYGSVKTRHRKLCSASSELGLT